VSGFLRNLSAQALGRRPPVRSVARLPYAAIPAMLESPAGEQAGAVPSAPVASVAPPANIADRAARSEPGVTDATPPILLPRGQDDARDAALSTYATHEPADRGMAARVMTPPSEPAGTPHVSVPPALVPTAHSVPPPAFVPPPPAGTASATDPHRPSAASEATEVHVSIGRIELTAVHEARPPPARRAAPAKPSQSLHEYLGQRQRRPS
jgi:hypothetical protein